MRIVHLSDSALPSRDANGVNATRMCQAFAAQGHDVALLSRDGDPAGVAALAGGDDAFFVRYGVSACFECVRLPAPRSGVGAELRYALAARRWLASRPAPDILYARHLLALAMAAPAGGRKVYEAHRPPRGAARLLMRALVRDGRLARIVAISAALRAEILRVVPGLDPGCVVVAHDGADPPAPPFDGGGLPQTGSESASGRLRVGYIGHLYPGKGMETVAALARALPEVDFHVVGGRDEDLARWRARTRASANLVLHGYVPPAATDAWRAAMDVLLAPYQQRVALRGGVGDVARWMSPLKVFEAMAAGRPIVASDLPVLREVLRDGRESLLVAPGDLRAWVAAVEALRDPGLRKRLGEAGQARFRDHYTWSARARRVVEGLA